MKTVQQREQSFYYRGMEFLNFILSAEYYFNGSQYFCPTKNVFVYLKLF